MPTSQGQVVGTVVRDEGAAVSEGGRSLAPSVGARGASCSPRATSRTLPGTICRALTGPRDCAAANSIARNDG